MSAYGYHLVYIVSREQSHLPPLDQLHARVNDDWRLEQHRAADARIYERLRMLMNHVRTIWS